MRWLALSLTARRTLGPRQGAAAAAARAEAVRCAQHTSWAPRRRVRAVAAAAASRAQPATALPGRPASQCLRRRAQARRTWARETANLVAPAGLARLASARHLPAQPEKLLPRGRTAQLSPAEPRATTAAARAAAVEAAGSWLVARWHRPQRRAQMPAPARLTTRGTAGSWQRPGPPGAEPAHESRSAAVPPKAGSRPRAASRALVPRPPAHEGDRQQRCAQPPHLRHGRVDGRRLELVQSTQPRSAFRRRVARSRRRTRQGALGRPARHAALRWRIAGLRANPTLRRPQSAQSSCAASWGQRRRRRVRDLTAPAAAPAGRVGRRAPRRRTRTGPRRMAQGPVGAHYAMTERALRNDLPQRVPTERERACGGPRAAGACPAAARCGGRAGLPARASLCSRKVHATGEPTHLGRVHIVFGRKVQPPSHRRRARCCRLRGHLQAFVAARTQIVQCRCWHEPFPLSALTLVVMAAHAMQHVFRSSESLASEPPATDVAAPATALVAAAVPATGAASSVGVSADGFTWDFAMVFTAGQTEVSVHNEAYRSVLAVTKRGAFAARAASPRDHG